jgi:hypothetical protein
MPQKSRQSQEEARGEELVAVLAMTDHTSGETIRRVRLGHSVNDKGKIVLSNNNDG